MRYTSFILAVSSVFSAALGNPVTTADAAVNVAEPVHVGEHYALLHRDLPEDLSADNNTHLSTEDYHNLLSKRGCDPIGCYANGYFSVLFDAGGYNWVRLFGENQPEQKHVLNCNGRWTGFNSWLPYVFMSQQGLCGGSLNICCNSYSAVYFKYASIDTRADGDSRCSNTGGKSGRCIFPMRP